MVSKTFKSSKYQSINLPDHALLLLTDFTLHSCVFEATARWAKMIPPKPNTLIHLLTKFYDIQSDGTTSLAIESIAMNLPTASITSADDDNDDTTQSQSPRKFQPPPSPTKASPSKTKSLANDNPSTPVASASKTTRGKKTTVASSAAPRSVVTRASASLEPVGPEEISEDVDDVEEPSLTTPVARKGKEKARAFGECSDSLTSRSRR